MPKTIDEAAEALLTLLSSEQKAQLRALNRDGLVGTHFGLGMFVRNKFALWDPESPLTKPPAAEPNAHPDDVSVRIVERAWNALHVGLSED